MIAPALETSRSDDQLTTAQRSLDDQVKKVKELERQIRIKEDELESLKHGLQAGSVSITHPVYMGLN